MKIQWNTGFFNQKTHQGEIVKIFPSLLGCVRAVIKVTSSPDYVKGKLIHLPVDYLYVISE